MLRSGIIIKGISGYYYVKSGDSLIDCRARGIFRKLNVKPMVGDIVDIEVDSNNCGTVVNIHERKNRLVRPAVSNVDSLLVVLSAGYPEPDLLLCDKLIINAMINNIEPIICLNKTDVGTDLSLEKINDSYSMFKTVKVSAKEKAGLEDLKCLIRKKTFALAGQSAVGKSSIINSLDEKIHLDTGDVSKKTNRGRHTTRAAELIYLSGLDSFVIDTPGFSSLDLNAIEPSDLRLYYPDFMLYNHMCSYSSCVHINEPDCAVKKAVEEGKICKSRYERYIKLMNALLDAKERTM